MFKVIILLVLYTIFVYAGIPDKTPGGWKVNDP